MDTRTGMTPVCGAILLCILAILSIRAWQGANLASDFRGLSANFSFQNIDTEIAQLRNELRDNLGLASDSLDATAAANLPLVAKPPANKQDSLSHTPAGNFSLEKLAQSRHLMLGNKVDDYQPVDNELDSAILEYVEPSEDLQLDPSEMAIASSKLVFPDPNMIIQPASIGEPEPLNMLDDTMGLFPGDRIIQQEPEFVAVYDDSASAQQMQSSATPIMPVRPLFGNESDQQTDSDWQIDLDVQVASSEQDADDERPTIKPKVSTRKASSKKRKSTETFAWTYPQGLVDEIRIHTQNPMTASWAHSTIQVLNELKYLNDLADENILIILEQLAGQVEQLDFLTAQASTGPAQSADYAQGVLATQLRQLRYSIERRLQIWPAIHALAKSPTERIGLVDNSQVGQFLSASSYRLNTDSVESGWANYLKLPDATKVFNSLNANKFAKKKAARAVLGRLYSPSLNKVQKRYLNSSIDDLTINVLKVCATDNVDLAQLVKRLEKFEENTMVPASST